MPPPDAPARRVHASCTLARGSAETSCFAGVAPPGSGNPPLFPQVPGYRPVGFIFWRLFKGRTRLRPLLFAGPRVSREPVILPRENPPNPPGFGGARWIPGRCSRSPPFSPWKRARGGSAPVGFAETATIPPGKGEFPRRGNPILREFQHRTRFSRGPRKQALADPKETLCTASRKRASLFFAGNPSKATSAAISAWRWTTPRPPRDGGRWPLPFGGAQPSRTTVVGEG